MDYFPVILIFIPFESKFFKTQIKSFSFTSVLFVNIIYFQKFHMFCCSHLFTPFTHKNKQNDTILQNWFSILRNSPAPHTLPYNLFCVCFMSFYSLCFYSHLSSLFIFRYDFIRPSNCYNFFDTLVFWYDAFRFLFHFLFVSSDTFAFD